MTDKIRKKFSKTTVALVALALVLSVLGPVGTVAAVEGITVDQQADSTTVNPGDTITFTTEVGVDDTQITAKSIGLQTNVQQGALPGWEVTSRSNVNNFVPGPDGFLWFAPNNVSGSATAQYTVSIPDDAEPGDYEVAVTASTEGGESTTDTTTITVEDTNSAPSADAGDDQTVDENTQVTLDASGSSDPDGDDLTYSWTQTDGTDVSLSDASSASPGARFTAPTLTESETLTFEVEVSDGQASDTDTVSVTVNPVNADPTASISGPTSTQVGEQVTFTASASDEDGSIASYSWDFDGDGEEDASGDSASYTFDSTGDYDVQLTVTDNEGATATATQTVSVSEAPDPANFQVSNLDAPSSATVGDTVTVSATVENTGDQQATKTVEFSFDGNVEASEEVTLAGGASRTVEFTLDTSGVALGTYSHSISTEDGAASAQIQLNEQAAPANFQVSNLDVPSVTKGETATVTATVENTGDEEGTQTVALSVDGNQVDSQSVTLAGGASDTVEFTLGTGDLSIGSHDVSVASDDDSATGSLMVEEPDDGGDAPSTTVSLSPASDEVTVGGTTTYDLVVDTADGGVGAYSATVSLDDASVAAITGVELQGDPGDQTTNVEIAEDGSSITIDAALMDTADSGSVTVATITVQSSAAGTTGLSTSVEALGTEDGISYEVTGTTGADLTVTAFSVGNFPPANDLDDDGTYEDVNGDGEISILDVQVLFANLDDSTIQNNPDAFDFNDDGVVNIVDVQALFAQYI